MEEYFIVQEHKFLKKYLDLTYLSSFSWLENKITGIQIPGNRESIGTIITEKTFNYNFSLHDEETLKPYIRCNIDFKISQENLDFLKSNKRIEKK